MLKRDFSKNMMERRKYLNLRPSDLGNLSGVGKSTISYIEAGQEKSNPTLDRVEMIAKALKVPAWYLLVSSDDFDAAAPVNLLALSKRISELNTENKTKVMNYVDDMLKLQELGDK